MYSSSTGRSLSLLRDLHGYVLNICVVSERLSFLEGGVLWSCGKSAQFVAFVDYPAFSYGFFWFRARLPVGMGVSIVRRIVST